MSLTVVDGSKVAQVNSLLEAIERGRTDQQFFSRAFLNRELHDGQLEYVENADGTVNCLATANRYGKTTVLSHIHYHGCAYKTGGEPRYLDPVTGAIDQTKWLRLKYHTMHTADLWETSALVWDEAKKIRGENSYLAAIIKAAPESKPPHIDFLNGARWKFRTLGHDASGIDGNSFYIISLDEAGWITDLERKMDNVIRVRVADVRGVIHLVGTFKPGISRDFYKYCVRAAAHTGRRIAFDHRTDEEDLAPTVEAGLDESISRYLRDFFRGWVERGKDINAELAADLAKLGVTVDEFADAATRGG